MDDVIFMLTLFSELPIMVHMTETFPTLYDLARTGKTKIWNISAKSFSNLTECHVVITHGEEGGKQQETVRRVLEGKNIGKANETSPFEQAKLEAASLWTKKKDKGYVPNRPTSADVKATTSRLPMLAQKFKERKHNIVWPAYVQPKLNGARCIVERTKTGFLFHSRGSKLFVTLAHLEKDLAKVMEVGELRDGEIYNHDMLTMQEVMSFLKNASDPNPDLAKYIDFWNYDVPENAPFKKRMLKIRGCGQVREVPTYKVQNEAEVMKYHAQFVQDGFEGTIIRSGGDEPYVFQYRSTSLQKYKDFIDEEFEIVGAEEGVGKAEGQATFQCKTKDGQVFGARCKGPNRIREEQWVNRNAYIGCQLTVRYQNLSDDGVPVFPVGIVVRDYE